jgi:hypothetical protein
VRVRAQDDALVLASGARGSETSYRQADGDLRAAGRVRFSEAVPVLEALRVLDELPAWAWRAAARYDTFEFTERALPRGVRFTLVLARERGPTPP